MPRMQGNPQSFSRKSLCFHRRLDKLRKKRYNIDIEFSLSTALIADSLFLCGSHSAYYVCIIEVVIYDPV